MYNPNTPKDNFGADIFNQPAPESADLYPQAELDDDSIDGTPDVTSNSNGATETETAPVVTNPFDSGNTDENPDSAESNVESAEKPQSKPRKAKSGGGASKGFAAVKEAHKTCRQAYTAAQKAFEKAEKEFQKLQKAYAESKAKLFRSFLDSYGITDESFCIVSFTEGNTLMGSIKMTGAANKTTGIPEVSIYFQPSEIDGNAEESGYGKVSLYTDDGNGNETNISLKTLGIKSVKAFVPAKVKMTE